MDASAQYVIRGEDSCRKDVKVEKPDDDGSSRALQVAFECSDGCALVWPEDLVDPPARKEMRCNNNAWDDSEYAAGAGVYPTCGERNARE